MNEDKCKRRIAVFPDAPDSDPLGKLASLECGKPKDPEKLYCPDCEREVYDETLHK